MSGEAGGVEYKFLWFIENYAYSWHLNGETLKSPFFTADRLEGTDWFMTVHPRGHRAAGRGYLSAFLSRGESDEGPEAVPLNYELSVLAADGTTLLSIVNESTFQKGAAVGWPQFVGMEELPRDTLAVRARIWRGEGGDRRVVSMCARTRIAVERVSFLHAVENFSALEPNGKKTAEIPIHSHKGLLISSSLHFDDAGEVTVEITPSRFNYTLCRRKISLLDASGNAIACGESDNRLPSDGRNIRKLPLSLTRQAILNEKSEYLPEDKLSLLCECVFSTGLEFEKIEDTQLGLPKACVPQAANEKSDRAAQKDSAFPSVVEDMKALYLNERLTDVVLKTKTKSFPAHKTVLCARSPVFEAMMTNDMRERNTGCIPLEDLEEDVVRQLLLFLYSDDVGDLRWDSATRLYYAADKYQVRRLRGVCSAFLLGHLTPSNAGELLVLADAHCDDALKNTVEEFILQHEKEVFGSEEWESLMNTDPLLAVTTMQLKYKR